MSQRNRIVLATLALVAAAALATPPPARATGLFPWRVAAAGTLERTWTWMARWAAGTERTPPSGREKEGGAINPNGGTPSVLTVPTPPTSPSGNGGGGK